MTMEEGVSGGDPSSGGSGGVEGGGSFEGDPRNKQKSDADLAAEQLDSDFIELMKGLDDKHVEKILDTSSRLNAGNKGLILRINVREMASILEEQGFIKA